jgi:hypothetical protein
VHVFVVSVRQLLTVLPDVSHLVAVQDLQLACWPWIVSVLLVHVAPGSPSLTSANAAEEARNDIATANPRRTIPIAMPDDFAIGSPFESAVTPGGRWR